MEPSEVINAVETYVYSEINDARKYDNREPFDESGVWSLHKLAADIYAMGWEAGERAQAERDRHQARRDEDRDEASEEAAERQGGAS